MSERSERSTRPFPLLQEREYRFPRWNRRRHPVKDPAVVEMIPSPISIGVHLCSAVVSSESMRPSLTRLREQDVLPGTVQPVSRLEILRIQSQRFAIMHGGFLPPPLHREHLGEFAANCGIAWLESQ
jgi:hypothetical protein